MSKSGFRIIFMGSPDFAVPSLQALLASHHRVAAVVTQPDRGKGRGRKLSPPPVKALARQHDIDVLQPVKIKSDEFIGTLEDYRPDLIVVAAYGRILPPAILDLPPLGCINVHGSLLPRHRGAAPIQWAVIEGDRQTGVTIMQMDEGMDTGDILLRQAIDVEENETAGTLFDKLARLGADSLLRALDLLEKDELTPKIQDHSQATKAPPLSKKMGLIDWSLPAQELHRLIRGLDPWPSAYTFHKGKRLRLFSPRVVRRHSDEAPGTILQADGSNVVVSCGHDALAVGALQPEGKKRLSAEAFICGYRLTAGDRFDNG